MPEQQQTDALSLHAFMAILRRRMSVLIACALIVPGAALGFSLLQQKKYSARSAVLTQDSASTTSTADRTRAAATNLTLGELGLVADRTARKLGTVSSGEISSAVSLSAPTESDIVTIRVNETDPALAARAANVFAQEYIRLLSSVGTDAKLVQPASVPSAPSSPKPVRNAVLGAVLGIILGILLALLLDRLDRRIRDPREVERVFDRPILGAIPKSRALSEDRESHLPPGEAEAFRMLRANLRYFNIDQSIQSVLITSAAPGDGKSTVAWNLTAAFAGAGSRALLIEADLRHPTAAARHPLTPTPGLTNVISGEARLQDVAQKVPVPLRQNGKTPSRTMDVVTAGPLPPNPTDLIESERMAEVIRAAEDLYDLVVIDTPPTAIVSDAIPLVTRVSGVIVVSRLGKSIRESLVHLRNQFRNLDAPTLGVVVNALGGNESGYGYGNTYGYSYEGVADVQTEQAPAQGIPASAEDAPAEDRGRGTAFAAEPPVSAAIGTATAQRPNPAATASQARDRRDSPRSQPPPPGSVRQRRQGLLGRLFGRPGPR
jgi:capsular exopolysaccharide synthesis family protein